MWCVWNGKKLLKKKHREEQEEPYVETITFKHICPECNHVICDHLYEFSLGEEFQEYSMDCSLCGFGAATRSIDPVDPRLMNELL